MVKAIKKRTKAQTPAPKKDRTTDICRAPAGALQISQVARPILKALLVVVVVE